MAFRFDTTDLAGPVGTDEPAREQLLPLRETRRLARVLAFCGHGIDDVVNDPIARRRVVFYFKLDRQIDRRRDAIELERQWNPLGRSA